jgi:dienelactone hydrolase
MVRIVQKIAVIFLLLAFFPGCLYYGKYGSRPLSRPTTFNPDPDYFAYEKESLPLKSSTASDRGKYTVQKLRFSTHTAFLYLPKVTSPSPAVIVLPITQGNYHSKQMAHFLADRGFVGLRFDSRGDRFARVRTGEKPIEAFEQFLKEYVIDVLRSVDWLREHPRVDPERIGIMGISMGGLVAAIATGVDPRIKAGVLMLAGGNLTGILLSTKEPSLVEVRKRIEDQEDLTREELRREMELRFRNIDPLVYAERIDPSNVLMINAFFDQVIKKKHTMAFWKTSGKPPMVQLPTGHYTAAVFFDYAERRTLAHFQQVLGRPRPTMLTGPAPAGPIDDQPAE